MKVFKPLLSTVAALVMAGSFSWGANLPLISGPQDPSQINATLNALIQSINAGVNGIVAVNTSAVGTNATTTEQTLQSITVNSNTLSAAGQSLRVRCFGSLAANSNTKQLRLMVTSTTTPNGALISTVASSVQGSWNLELLLTYAASSTNTNWVGTGSIGNQLSSTNTNLASTVMATNTVINWANAVTVSCSGIAATSPADITAQELLIEQIK